MALVAEVVKQTPGDALAWQLQGDLLAQAKAPAAEQVAAYRQTARLRPDGAAVPDRLGAAVVGESDYGGGQDLIAGVEPALPHAPPARYPGQGPNDSGITGMWAGVPEGGGVMPNRWVAACRPLAAGSPPRLTSATAVQRRQRWRTPGTGSWCSVPSIP